MNRWLPLLLIVSFSGIALFGFGVTAGPHAGCVADAFQELQGSACPAAENSLALLASHLSSLKGFVGNFGIGFLALAVLAAFALIAWSAPPIVPQVVFRRSHEIFFAPVVARAKRVSWTARHEASPTPLH